MFDEIKSKIKGEIASDEETLAKYSRDASLFEVRPQVVVFPKDVEDIKTLVRLASKKKKTEQDISLTVRAGGSDMTGGPLSESIVLDLTQHFNNIKTVGDGVAVVEPGVFYRDFEKETLKSNLLLPSFPASRELCTLGGMVANDAGGEKTLAYGKTSKYVKSLKVVMADGNEYEFHAVSGEELEAKLSMSGFEGDLYRKVYELVRTHEETIKLARPHVSKNSSGYYLWEVWDGFNFDLSRLIVGSQGTLGIVTEITFKLIRPKPYSRLLVIFLRDLDNLGSIINSVLKYNPEAFESYDKHTLKLALKFIPQFIKRMRGNFISLAFKFLPEVLMVLRGGLPRLVLTAEFTGESQAEVNRKISAAASALSEFKVKTRITRDEMEADKYKLIRRESFNLLRSHVRDKQTAPFIDDIIVEPHYLSRFLPELENILKNYNNMIYTIAGHVGNGNFHIIPLMKLSDPKVREEIPELTEKVYSLVFKYGGSMSAEHNDGLIRSPYLRQMFGAPMYELFEQVKRIFDPLNIFNPGKKVGANLVYSVKHFKNK